MIKKITAVLLSVIILFLAACSRPKRVDSLELSKRLEKIKESYAFDSLDTYIVNDEHIVFISLVKANDCLLSYTTDGNNSITEIRLTIDAENWDKNDAAYIFGEYAAAVLSAFSGCAYDEALNYAKEIGLFDESAYFNMHEAESSFDRYSIKMYANPLCAVAEFIYSPSLVKTSEASETNA